MRMYLDTERTAPAPTRPIKYSLVYAHYVHDATNSTAATHCVRQPAGGIYLPENGGPTRLNPFEVGPLDVKGE